MKSYLQYFKLRVITNLQYRADALAGFATQLFFGFLFILVYMAFYKGSNTSLPMNKSNLITYLWLQQAFFALIYPYERDSELFKMIKDGNLAYEIIRPQNLYIKFFIKIVAKKFVNALLRSIPLILVVMLLPEHYKIMPPASFLNGLYFIIAIIFSTLLVSAMSTIINLLTMFTLDPKGLVTIYGTIAEILSGTNIPIPFFPPILQKIAYVLPFRYIADFPFRIYSNDIPLSEFGSLLTQSIIWLIVSIIIGNLVSKLVLRKAVINGG